MGRGEWRGVVNCVQWSIILLMGCLHVVVYKLQLV